MEEYIFYPNQIWKSIINKNLQIFTGIENLYDLSLSNNLLVYSLLIFLLYNFKLLFLFLFNKYIIKIF